MKVGKGVFVYLGLLASSVCAGQNVADSIVNVPYSIGRANTELLKDNKSVMIQDALIGAMPGVRVVQSSGDPNSNPQILIRGRSSYYYSNDPLYVLDGVIIDAPNLLNNHNTMGFLNPDDIASITVLKDAAATSVYGSRGLNGVILLTSKKGTKNLKVNYSGNFSISTARRVDVLTGDELRDIWDKIPKSASEKAGYNLGKDNCNYQDLIYQAAFGTKNTFSVSGNISPIHTPFRVSLGIVNQNGVIKTNLYQRYNALVSLSPSLFQDHFKINANFRASHEKSQHVDETVVNSAIFTDPTRDNSDGNIIWDIGGMPLFFQNPNPVSQIRDEYLKNKTNRYNGNIALNYKAHDFEALSFNVNGAFDIMRNNYEGGIDAKSQYSFSQNLMGSSFRREYSCDRNNYYLDGNIAYNNTFKYGNTIGVQIGYYLQQINRSEKYDFEGYNSNWFFDKNNYGKNRYDYPEYDYSYNNFYSRVNYNYKEKYFITAAVGREKKVNPSPRNENQEVTYKVYPSVGIAWNVSKEKFLKNVSAINNLTVRGSYSVNSENNYYPKVIRVLECVNAEVESFTIGSDFSLMNNRLTGSLEYYNRNIKNGVYLQEYKYGDPNIPDTKSPTNMDFKNEGVEFSINGLLIKNRELTWNIGANLTWQSSKVLKRHTEFTKIVSEKFDNYNNYTLFEKNQTPGTYYIYPNKFNENGEEIVVDGDNEIYPISTDKSSLPSVYFGLNTNLVYKNWDFSFNGHGAFGGYLYNVVDAKGLRGALSGIYEVRNLTQNIVDKGWEYMRYTDSDEFLQNASFFKIDNITLGYTFKNLWSGNSSLRASFNAHNIATITSYKGIDPEIISAYDDAGYRIPRSYSISLNLNF